jgi:hypothetical protein
MKMGDTIAIDYLTTVARIAFSILGSDRILASIAHCGVGNTTQFEPLPMGFEFA